MIIKHCKVSTYLAEYRVFVWQQLTALLIMLVLCSSLISCAASNKNNQDEVKQVQTEQKLPASQEITKSADKSKQQRNQHTNTPDQDAQQKTTADNYSSEVKSARTSGEETAQIEGKLDQSLSNFDEMLLKKNEELSVLKRREEGVGGAAIQGGAESGLGEQGEDGQSGGSVAASNGSGQTIAGTMSQDKEYDNDDIVARQIREAAEKETDPELKKKLWEEYKKYKTGSN